MERPRSQALLRDSQTMVMGQLRGRGRERGKREKREMTQQESGCLSGQNNHSAPSPPPCISESFGYLYGYKGESDFYFSPHRFSNLAFPGFVWCMSHLALRLTTPKPYPLYYCMGPQRNRLWNVIFLAPSSFCKEIKESLWRKIPFLSLFSVPYVLWIFSSNAHIT